MKLEIKEIENKEILENFLLECDEKSFLSSWNWGEFQKMMGNKIWRLGVFKNEQLVGVVLATKIIARRGTFLLIQHGPHIKSKIKNRAPHQNLVFFARQKSKILEILLDKLKGVAKEENCAFIRLNPLWERNQENQHILKSFGFREAPIHANSYEATLKLNLTPSEEELLTNMRKTTRYLIRQAQKDKDIEVFQSRDISDIETFYKIHLEVVKVQKFIPFSLEYLKKEFLVFNEDNQIAIFFGKYRGEIIAASYVLFWSGIGFYHHAALLPKFHKIPISYLLLWEAIKEAKKRGCKIFDFWGFVDPQKKPKHPWAGPTLFKIGFGGRPFEYVNTQDFPLSKKYWLIFVFEKLRKIKRGL